MVLTNGCRVSCSDVIKLQHNDVIISLLLLADCWSAWARERQQVQCTVVGEAEVEAESAFNAFALYVSA